ncbi:hypothetical protein [Chitinophaga sp. sic0106]|uniref:hypothetical protein n=1 Tax=Chitinophaga sp. sic0106 TaxID=2854785 RepID=UPI001C46A000|nr:hypothetical protein [Chitinophaga sp. sic0106]MBV7531326.1 hypothetical protein [Chitinophaga sp. sic0106]
MRQPNLLPIALCGAVMIGLGLVFQNAVIPVVGIVAMALCIKSLINPVCHGNETSNRG